MVYRDGLGAYGGGWGERLFHVPPAPHTQIRRRNILYTENAFDFIFLGNNERKKNVKQKRVTHEL